MVDVKHAKKSRAEGVSRALDVVDKPGVIGVMAAAAIRVRSGFARGARTTKLLLVWKLAVSAKICIEAE